jgi:hypothetical protein
MTRLLVLLALLATPALADGDHPKPPPPPIVCERPLCPSLETVLESREFEALDCRQQGKLCKAAAAGEFRCEKALATAQAKSAAGACETRECRREVRDYLRATIRALRADRKASRLRCKAVCG